MNHFILYTFGSERKDFRFASYSAFTLKFLRLVISKIRLICWIFDDDDENFFHILVGLYEYFIVVCRIERSVQSWSLIFFIIIDENLLFEFFDTSCVDFWELLIAVDSFDKLLLLLLKQGFSDFFDDVRRNKTLSRFSFDDVFLIKPFVVVVVVADDVDDDDNDVGIVDDDNKFWDRKLELFEWFPKPPPPLFSPP